MCQRATCPSCGKPTYRGCGMHIEQVLGDVLPADRCRCAAAAKENRTAKGALGGMVDWLRGK